MEKFGVFQGLVIWYICCHFGTFFSNFDILYHEISGNPGSGHIKGVANGGQSTDEAFLLYLRKKHFG
jgi:hypothetical protein